MSEFECPVVKIKAVIPVPKSDNLEMTEVFEAPVIFRKGQLKVGDLAVYIPVESVVPMNEPQFQGLGIKTEKNLYRVKAVRLRGTYSEGLLVPYTQTDGSVALGKDMAPAWGITKYEEPEVQVKVGTQQEKDLAIVPRYGVEQLVRHRHLIEEGQQVVVTEKVHGCSGRYMYGKDPHGVTRLNVGSHNTWRRPVYKGKFIPLKRFINRLFGNDTIFDLTPINTDEWWTIAKNLKLESKLSRMPNMVFYGEVYGKVQDLKYGLSEGVDFRVFDIYDTASKTWLRPELVEYHCQALDLKTVPVLYSGPYSKEVVDPLRTGMSVLDSNTIREGIVVKPAFNKGKHVALKLVSEKYKLRKNGSEFH